jgi:trehalose/maltose hydrolase-like predicted phosphorylase
LPPDRRAELVEALDLGAAEQLHQGDYLLSADELRSLLEGRALHSDVTDIQGGTTAEGIHLGAMAGSFARLETRHDALGLNPHWPRRYSRLEFEVRYRHVALTVAASGREVRVAAHPGPGGAVRVGCGDKVRDLCPGETAEFHAVSTFEVLD